MPTPQLQPKFEPVVIDRRSLKALGVSFSNAYLLELEHAGRFPRRVQLGKRNSFWVYAEIMAFLQERTSERARAASLATLREASHLGVQGRAAARATARPGASKRDAA